MAVHTLGTNSNTSIANALTFLPGWNSGMAAADVATLNTAIADDQGNLHLATGQLAPFNSAFTVEGNLLVPNRGILKVFAGDVVGVDSRGWPILLSKDTIANGPWHFV